MAVQVPIVAAAPNIVAPWNTPAGTQMIPVGCVLSSAGDDPAGPFSCALTWSLPLPNTGPSSSPGQVGAAYLSPQAAAAQLVALLQNTPVKTVAPWAQGADLYSCGVRALSPPTGVGATILGAIDAACAAFIFAGGSLDGQPVTLAVLAAWMLWRRAGGLLLPGGDGGPLQAPLYAALDPAAAGPAY